MIIQILSFFLILLSINTINSIALAANIMADNAMLSKKECTGKIAKKRQPLFINAEESEKKLILAYSLCLNNNDCDTNQLYQQTKKDIQTTIIALITHLNNLEEKNDGACYVCEKKETKHIKDRLSKLLEVIL